MERGKPLIYGEKQKSRFAALAHERLVAMGKLSVETVDDHNVSDVGELAEGQAVSLGNENVQPVEEAPRVNLNLSDF